MPHLPSPHLVWTCFLALAAVNWLAAQVSPEKARETLVTANDVQVDIFAHEPMLVNPTSLDIDHMGRIWVAEAVNYRRINFNRPILRPEGDRIVVLIDEKGQGQATRAVTFYQGPDLYGPLSVCVIPQPDGKALRVLVAQSPDILEFWDRDGDLKADGPPKKFLTGFGGFDHDHGVHGLHVGPDGKLYFTVGDSGVGQGKDRDGKPIPPLQSRDGKGRKWVSNASDCRAGTVWRCELDGTNLELIAHNFRNNYEACVDSYGEIWLSDNDDDGNQQTRICFVLPGGNYGYHPRGPGESHWHEEQPGIVHKVLRTGFGSPTGITFYEGTLFSPKYAGALLHCDAGPREVRAFFRKPKGAGYELDKEILLTSTDPWFRPSDVCVAPDGSIFVADWYDPGVGGHGMGDWTRGRLYRLTPKGHHGYRVPAHDVMTPGGLAAAYQSPCQATRTQAILRLRALKEGHPDFENAVVATLFAGLGGARPSEQPWLVARALWQRTKELADSFLRIDLPRQAGDTADHVAAQRIRQYVAHFPTLAHVTAEQKDQALELIKTTTPTIRRELALALRHADPSLVRELFYPLARQYTAQDHFYRAALNIACGADPARRQAILADFDQHFPEWNDRVAELVWELRPDCMLPKIQAWIAQYDRPVAQRSQMMEVLAVYEGSNSGRVLLNILSSELPAALEDRAVDLLQKYLPNRWRELASSSELKAVIERTWAKSGRQLQSLKLIAAARYSPAVEAVKALASDRSAPAERRSEAIRTLGQLPGDKGIRALVELLNDPEHPNRLDVISALGIQLNAGAQGEGYQQALAALQDLVLASSATAEELRTRALEVLASTRVGADWLLTLRESQRLPESLVGPTGRLLRNSPFQAQRNKAMLLFPPPGKLDPNKLPSIPTLARQRGNADRGQQLLSASRNNEAQCLKCHTIRGMGGHVGPDLSMIGLKASRENLLESILNPSKAIADQFVQYTIETKNGQVISGILVGQGNGNVTLRDANGKDHILTREDVETMTKSPTSIMPADIVKAFSEEELLDVVEYLLTLRTPAYTPLTWFIVGPFRAKSMLEGLKQVYQAEIHPVEPTDTFTETGERIPIVAGRPLGRLTWTKVHLDATGYIDLAALHRGAANHSVSYAYTAIESPADQNATVLLGSDDGAKLFVNGECVFTEESTRAAAPNQNRIPIRLKRGINTILLKVANGDGPHGFYLTIESSQELKSATKTE